MRLFLVLIFMAWVVLAKAQEEATGLEKYAEPEGILPWLSLGVIAVVALILIASLLFSKKKDYTK